MTVLALDIATITGFAFGGPNDGAPRTGTWKLPALDKNLDGALSSLFESVSSMCGITQASTVAIEAPLKIVDRYHGWDSALGLFSLVAVARCAAHRHGARVRLYEVKTVRKHFIGVGVPDNPKRDVMERCKLLRWHVEDDNAADAAALWSYAMATLYPKWAPKATPLFARGAAA